MDERLAPGLLRGSDGRVRCAWPGDDDAYVAYHDREWGRPVADDRRILEKIVLEGFQSGLSWRTILHKRARFREVFHDFDAERIARFDAGDVERLLSDPGIVRHRGKIEAAIANARATLALYEREGEGALARILWSFEPGPDERPETIELATLRQMASTPASARLAKTLRGHGFRFFGPTTAYAAMQALGLVNDHLEGCAQRAEIDRARARFRRPR